MDQKVSSKCNEEYVKEDGVNNNVATVNRRHEKIRLFEINPYLTCHLCNGYLIDATTISECLHSFCRSCIIKFLQENSYCPICEVIINKAKPNIKLDKTLQDIVYKLVPELFMKEMRRRQLFYQKHPKLAAKMTPEERGEDTERIIYNPRDLISLSLERVSDELSPTSYMLTQQTDLSNNNNTITLNQKVNAENPMKRFLQCPGMCRVDVLKKFVMNKYNVDPSKYHIDILYKRVPLPDHYTMIDVAYIYSWKRNEPLKFFYRITDINHVTERFDYIPSSVTQQMNKQITTEKGKVENRRKTKRVETKISKKVLQKLRKDLEKKTAEKSEEKVSLDKLSTNKEDLNAKGGDLLRNGAESNKDDEKTKTDVIKLRYHDGKFAWVDLKCKLDDIKKTIDNNLSLYRTADVKSEINTKFDVDATSVDTKPSIIEINKAKPKLEVTETNLIETMSNEQFKSELVHQKLPKIEVQEANQLTNGIQSKVKLENDRMTVEEVKSNDNKIVRFAEDVPNKNAKKVTTSQQMESTDTNRIADELKDIIKKNDIAASKNPVYTNITLNRSENLEIITKIQKVSNKNGQPIGLNIITVKKPNKKTNKQEICQEKSNGYCDADKQISLPDKQFPLTQKQISSPQKEIPSPQKRIPSPQKQIPSSQKRISLPQKQIPSPEKQISLPDKKISLTDNEDAKSTFLKNMELTPKASLSSAKPSIVTMTTTTTTTTTTIPGTSSFSTTSSSSSTQKRKNPSPLRNDRAAKKSRKSSLTSPTKKSSQTGSDNSELKLLFDNCNINIPSSLSITIKENGENNKHSHATIKPVQNYIEILKLPDTPSPNCVGKPDDANAKKESETKKSHLPCNVMPMKENFPKSTPPRSPKTFQKMFEESIKKADFNQRLQRIQDPLFDKNKCQKRALDLTTSPTPEQSTGNKKNILEIAFQLYKKNQFEIDRGQKQGDEKYLGKIPIPRLHKSQTNLVQQSQLKFEQTIANLHSASLGMNYTVSVQQQNQKTSITNDGECRGTNRNLISLQKPSDASSIKIGVNAEKSVCFP